MNNLFNVPENTIRSCDELYSKFAQKVAEKKANSNKDLTIKDIFFVATSTNGIRLVEKSSLSGRWLALKATILGAFGMESALSKGKKSVENLITTKNLFFNDKELIIKVLRDSGKYDQGDITALGEKIISFVDSISQTSLFKNIKVLPSSPQKIKIGETTASVLFADKIELRKRYSREFDSIFDEHKSDEREKIVSFLTQYSRTPELLEALKNRSTSPEGAANELRTALLRGAATATDKDFDTYYKALKLLETKEGFQGIVRDDPIPGDLTLGDFAAVFADDSISGSSVEGGVTSKVFADYGVECLDKMTFLTPAAKNFRKILANPINLRDNQKNPGDIKTDIQERLNSLPEGSQRCLLLGGWSGHGIVYEIERQRDGKYAMRVYNQGEGAQYHDVVSEGYHERRAGCIGIVDISEKLIFKRSFLGNLQGLNSLKNGDEFLVNDILPMLAGKKEEIDPQIKHYLSPQRSGTCTYKSLQAFFAHSMSEVEYRHFKLQYKLHLLEKYLPTLKRNANVKIADMDVYQKT